MRQLNETEVKQVSGAGRKGSSIGGPGVEGRPNRNGESNGGPGKSGR